MRGLLLMLLVWFGAQAGEPGFSLAAVKEAGAGLRTLRLPFVQEKKLALFEEPLLTPGLVEVSRPLAAVRWEFTGQVALLLRDGVIRRVNLESGLEESLGAREANRALGQQMRSMLSGDWSSLTTDYTVTPDPGGQPLVTIEPKDAGLRQFVSRLVLRFRPDLRAPAELRLETPSGDRTTYRFGEPEVDPVIDERRFAGR